MSQLEAQAQKSQARTVGIASAIWASSIFLSRIIGLVREQVIGRTLGASRAADIYFASFTLPDFLNYLLAAGALSIVFIPIFLNHLHRGNENGAWRAFSVIANFILLAGGFAICCLVLRARAGQRRRARLHQPAGRGDLDPADPDHPARAILPRDRRPALRRPASAGQASAAGARAAGLFGVDHRRRPDRRADVPPSAPTVSPGACSPARFSAPSPCRSMAA